VSFEERIADLPALPTPTWTPSREPLTSIRATFSLLDLSRARIRALEAVPEVGPTLSADLQSVAGASMHVMGTLAAEMLTPQNFCMRVCHLHCLASKGDSHLQGWLEA